MLTLDAFLTSLDDPAATLETFANDAGVDLMAILQDTGTSRSTFTRWKAGSGPRVGSLRRIAVAIRQAAAERATA